MGEEDRPKGGGGGVPPEALSWTGEPPVTTEADKALPAIELIGIDKSFGPVHANNHVNLVVERGVIHGIVGENGAGQIDADVDPLWLLRGRRGRNPHQRRAGAHPLVARGDQPRHRHGASALHAGAAAERARERHARRRGRPAARRRRRRDPQAARRLAANTASRSIRTRSSANCRSACSSGSRS